jgi:hypothetical protein
MGWVRNVVLIKCIFGSGKPKGEPGFWVGGYMGQMGEQGSQFTSNLGTRWTDPVTKGGFQVSRKGVEGEQRGAKGSKREILCMLTYVLLCI